MNRRGQALVEVAAFLFLTASLLGLFLGFTQRILVRQKILMAARQGAMLYSSGRFRADEVENLMRHFLANGFPSLEPSRMDLAAGRSGGFHGVLFQLDRVHVRYTIQSRWVRALGLNPTMEETCVIKHAAPYGLAWQPFYGPPVSWWAGSPVSD
jgi:hypothetical protein